LIFIPGGLLKVIIDEAEAAFPDECCGLLIGRDWSEDGQNNGRVVTRIAPSPNVTKNDPKTSFEVDPKIQFDLMREIRGTNKHIIGVYHSHPNNPAQPSSKDLAQAWEPDLTWLIVSVIDGQATHTSAHALNNDNSCFEEIGLRTTDWKPYPQREAT
jgi:proteasome lid subunit RPN8/RPN11